MEHGAFGLTPEQLQLIREVGSFGLLAFVVVWDRMRVDKTMQQVLRVLTRLEGVLTHKPTGGQAG